MLLKLGPGELLHELFQGAEPARKRHEGVRLHEHQVLSLMHVVDHDQLLDVQQHVLALAQKGRNDAGDTAAMAERRAGGLPHQAEAATAIDETDMRCRHDAAEVACGLDISRVNPRPRAAIDADILNASCLLHSHISHSPLGCVKKRSDQSGWYRPDRSDRFVGSAPGAFLRPWEKTASGGGSRKGIEQ